MALMIDDLRNIKRRGYSTRKSYMNRTNSDLWFDISDIDCHCVYQILCTCLYYYVETISKINIPMEQH